MKTLFLLLILATSTHAQQLMWINPTPAPPASGGGSDVTGYLARWKFDEGTGTSASDASGNFYTGTIVGTTKPAWVTGQVGPYALDWTSASSDAAVTFSGLPALSGSFTVTAWVDVATVGGNYHAVISQDGSHALFLHVSGGQYLVDFYFGGDHLSSSSVPTGGWHWIALVVSSSAATYYIDDIAAGTFTFSGSISFLEIGDDSSGEVFTGKIDDVRIYQSALTTGQLTTVFGVR